MTHSSLSRFLDRFTQILAKSCTEINNIVGGNGPVAASVFTDRCVTCFEFILKEFSLYM